MELANRAVILSVGRGSVKAHGRWKFIDNVYRIIENYL